MNTQELIENTRTKENKALSMGKQVYFKEKSLWQRKECLVKR